MKLEVHDLHKSFQGKEVLHGISFTIESGKALGLLGRNNHSHSDGCIQGKSRNTSHGWKAISCEGI